MAAILLVSLRILMTMDATKVMLEMVNTCEAVSAEKYLAENRVYEASRKREHRKQHPEYVEREKQAWARRRNSNRKLKPFAGIDGEGATVHRSGCKLRINAKLDTKLDSGKCAERCPHRYC